MIDTTLWILIFLYVIVAGIIVARQRGRSAKIILAFLFSVPAMPFIYRNVIFQIDCQQMVEEQVLDRRSNVDGLLVSYNWGIDTQWVNWLVEKGGYAYAEYKSGNEFERNYWHVNGPFVSVSRTSVPTSTARYEIQVIKSQPQSFIVKNEFVAIDRTTNKILGRKVLLFMQAGWISRYLNWKITNDMDRGGLTCPRISSLDDLLGFFPTKVLVPSAR